MLVEVAKSQGIPGYVVDGRYLILTKSIRGTDSFVDLVKELYEKTKYNKSTYKLLKLKRF